MKTRLKEIMQEKGMMSKTLAEKIGISEVSFSALVNGRSNNLETLAKAAKYLEVPLWQLFKEPEAEETSNGLNFTCPHCGKSISLKIEET